MAQREKRLIESTIITTGSIARKDLFIRAFRMHIKILPKHNFGRGAYYITFEDTNTGKEKVYAKV